VQRDLFPSIESRRFATGDDRRRPKADKGGVHAMRERGRVAAPSGRARATDSARVKCSQAGGKRSRKLVPSRVHRDDPDASKAASVPPSRIGADLERFPISRGLAGAKARFHAASSPKFPSSLPHRRTLFPGDPACGSRPCKEEDEGRESR